MPLHSISRSQGRFAFGDDPVGYAAVRPPYPDEFYAHLVQRCGLRAGSHVFEVGAGTGLATERLLSAGTSVDAIEPDPRLAAYLRSKMAQGRVALRVIESTFEAARMRKAHYDAGIAATSFHWVNPKQGYPKVRAAVKPGGWWAMWWTDFAVARETDPFQATIAHLFDAIPGTGQRSRDGGPPYPLNFEARLGDLRRAGLIDGDVRTWPESRSYSTAEIANLYKTFAPVRILPDAQREALLEELSRIADTHFGGHVERQFATVLYTARCPQESR